MTTAIWTGTAGDGLWSDAGNWQAHVVPTTGQDVEFDNLTGSGTPQIVQVNQPVEIGSLNIDNTILQGSSMITLDGDVTCGTSNYVSILAPVTLTHNTTLNVTNGTGGTFSDLQFCDPIGDGGHGYGLTVTGGGEVDIVPCTIQGGNAAYVNADVTCTYTGPTIVNDGSIFTVNGKLASSVTVSGDAQVFGSGSTISLSVSASGTEFGASDLYNYNPDVLTVADGLSLGAGTQFYEQMDGATVGDGSAATGFSEVDVHSGTIDLGGATLNGNLNTSLYTPMPGDVITVIKNQTGRPITGTFANLPQGAHFTENGYTFVISYHGGASGRDVTLTYPTTPTVSSATATVALSGKIATLSAVGADPDAAAGAAGLTYTWSVVSMPTGAKTPLFSANGTNSAKTSAVRLYKAGTYHFLCTVTNATGNTATTSVSLTVAQIPKLLRMTPHAQQLRAGASMQYSTIVLDQFNHVMRAAPAAVFSIASGAGTISDDGLFIAAEQIRGHVDILAEDDGISGTVSATVQ